MTTKQQIFNAVKLHLETQQGTCADSDGCVYRGPIISGPNEGKQGACAIGGIISDESAQYLMQNEIGVFARYDIESRKVARTEFGIRNKDDVRWDLLSDLQNIHDGFEVDEWAGKFRYFAEKFGLKL